MSRSHRKTPIHGITTCRSERTYKVLWHQRLRVHERSRMAAAKTDAERLEALSATNKRQVSNVWWMGKDGRQYISPKRQTEWAEADAQIGVTPQEQVALKLRSLRKQMAK